MFRNGDNSIQEPENFLHRFKRVLEAQDFDVERQWCRYLILCLSQDHARWVETNLAPSLGWDAVTRAFTRQFGDPYRLREARVTLFKLQMRPGETIGEYSRRFEDHMRSADMPDSERASGSVLPDHAPSRDPLPHRHGDRPARGTRAYG